MIYRVTNSALGARGVGSVLVEPSATVEVELDEGDAALLSKLDGVDVELVDDVETDISKMTVAELKAFAEANDIDLGDAEKKADILSAIELVLEAKD